MRVSERLGYAAMRQRGSHLRLRHPTDPNRLPLTVPSHRELDRGLLPALLRDAGVSVEQLRRVLD